MTQTFVKTRLKNPENCNFAGFVNLYSVRAICQGDNHTNTVAREKGKNDLIGKWGGGGDKKSQDSNLVGKIR